MTTKKVKKRESAKQKKQAISAGPKLVRTTISTSREMDFFSERELVTQTGHGVQEWPLVVVKELVDNALDACEETEVRPVIEIAADAAGISVRDNGPGLPEATLKAQLDFSIRASSREIYVAPDRGRQGNALKTILPMPRVIDAEHGKLIVAAHGKRHVITCGCDPISQQPVIHDDVSVMMTPGTLIRMEWGARVDGDEILWPFDGLWVSDVKDRFCALVEGFAVFNPHATIRLDWFGQKTVWKATDPTWEKWKPCQPTSAHWYELAHFERLVGAYITHDGPKGEDRLVSDLIAEFDGLSGSGKRTKVLEAAGLKRSKLSELVIGDRLDSERIGVLLAAMQKHTRPVNPRRLGILGEHHLRGRLLGMGILPESFRYSRKLSDSKKVKNSNPLTDDKPSYFDVPWILESAFGYLGSTSADRRKIVTGANWSAAIGNPFRSFGETDEGLETVLSDFKATRNEPVVFILHLAHPRVEYTDRGKSALVIGGAA